jgi:hypothetical protein
MSNLIQKENYHSYFENFSKVIPNELVEIEVMGLDLGDQIEADFVTLKGITYESKNNQLFFYLADNLEHIIKNPVEIYVDNDEIGIKEIAIKCGQGHLHLIKLKHAVELKN